MSPLLVYCRTLLPVSVVSVWSIKMNTRSGALLADLQHVAVGVPPGLGLMQLTLITAPLLHTVSVTPKWAKTGVLLTMPYVGEVDLRPNSNLNNVAITAITDGFVMRGTVSCL